MKQPSLKDLSNVVTEDQFIEKVEEVKTKSAEMARKTHTLENSNIDHINAVAFKLSQQRGKPVSASEALRLIIHEHKTRNKS